MSALRLFIAYIKKNNLYIDRNIITYIICVIIATILWFLNALNKDYTAEISYPVKYTNFPKGKHLVTELPKEIILEVNAKGFALLGYRVSTSFLPITFNVNTYCNHLLEKNDVFAYTLQTTEIKDKISNQLNADIKLLNIMPETIDFRFAHSVSKKIAILPQVNYTLKRQYILKNDITAIPDSIWVTGPSTIMDTLKQILTEQVNLKEIGKNTSKKIQLPEMPEISFEDTPVQIDIHVEQFTEAQKTVQITELNVPDSINLRLFPNYINITYEVGLSHYDKISDTDFNFTVDYKQCAISSYLEVRVKKIPPFIKHLTYTPQKVEYILEQRPNINNGK